MVGRVIYRREKGRGGLSLSYIGPLTVLSAELYEPEGLSPARLSRRLRRLERALAKQGVGRVLLPEGFPHGGLLERLRPVETLPFYRAVADVLALGWLDSRGIPHEKGRVALAAPWLCPELRTAAERLAPRVRELVIRAGEEGEDFARQLHRQFGLSVLPDTTPGDVTVAFGPAEGLRGEVLRLCGETPELGGLRLSLPGMELPADCGQPLLALLWEMGAADRSRLKATI